MATKNIGNKMQHLHLKEFSINEDFTNKRVKRYTQDEKKYSECKYGNEVLYKMCQNSPEHTNIDIVASKIWLIGRSYAAALERRKNSNGYNPLFYTEVANKFIKKLPEIDKTIKLLSKYKSFNEENFDLILELHYSLTNSFKEVTELNNRSLASKYLHFHCPNIFFIYDSRARHSLSKYVRKSKIKLENSEKIDYEYMIFCNRMLKLYQYIDNKFNQKLSPRELDNLLLYYTE